MQKSEGASEETQQLRKRQMTCIEGNFATKFCINSNCVFPGLICFEQENCQCSKTHKHCSFAKISVLKTYITKKQELASFYKQAHQSSIPLYQNIISEMINKLEKLIDSIDRLKTQACLSNSQAQAIKNLQFQKITGKMIAKLVTESQWPQLMIHQKKVIEQFWGKKKKLYDQIINSIQNECFFNYVPFRTYENNNYTPIILSKGKKMLFLDSKIISKTNGCFLADFIMQQTRKIPKNANLIYRASQNNFSIEQFYKKCGKIRNLVVVLITQFKKIIGGFTPQNWLNKQKQCFKKDESKSAFLFSLTLKQKYKCKCYMKSIACINSHNPSFGGLSIKNGSLKPDLFIGDNANQMQSCFSFFPENYGVRGLQKNFLSKQQASIRFTGQKYGQGYKVQQWQVFQIIFQGDTFKRGQGNCGSEI